MRSELMMMMSMVMIICWDTPLAAHYQIGSRAVDSIVHDQSITTRFIRPNQRD